jgi:hypothetical protein
LLGWVAPGMRQQVRAAGGQHDAAKDDIRAETAAAAVPRSCAFRPTL